MPTPMSAQHKYANYGQNTTIIYAVCCTAAQTVQTVNHQHIL